LDFDIVLKNGHVLDGTGNPWFKADLGIRDGKIAEISRFPLKLAERVIDAKGLIVCPGFVNLHSHSDFSILSHNNAENCLAMGLVTELTGHCGSSTAPITEKNKKVVVERLKDRTFFFDEKVDWLTLDEWMKRLEKKGVGINIAPLVGHGTIRSSVMGPEGEGGERIVPTKDEMDEMKAFVERAMTEGAFGLSTGLVYAPGRNALMNEVIELCKEVAKYGGLYASHIRDEGEYLIESTMEFIEICEKAGVRGVLSHHKAYFRNNFGKVCKTLKLVDEARAREVDVILDQYPWRHGRGNKTLAELVGFKASVKSRQELIKKLKDPEEWEKLKATAIERRDKEMKLYEERKKKLKEKGSWTQKPFDPESGFILCSKIHSEFEGKFLRQVADAMGASDIWEASRALLIDDEGYTCAHREPFSEEDVKTILKYPWTTVSTDQYAIDNSKVSPQAMADALSTLHPRGWGTYPKILSKYVREEKILTLEEAIRKMTSLPARFLGLWNRGIVREGFWADLVVFNPNTVENMATYSHPYLSPKGIPYVLVNGKLSVDEGKNTGALAGKVLRNNA